jgi:hypothetical protein
MNISHKKYIEQDISDFNDVKIFLEVWNFNTHMGVNFGFCTWSKIHECLNLSGQRKCNRLRICDVIYNLRCSVI